MFYVVVVWLDTCPCPSPSLFHRSFCVREARDCGRANVQGTKSVNHTCCIGALAHVMFDPSLSVPPFSSCAPPHFGYSLSLYVHHTRSRVCAHTYTHTLTLSLSLSLSLSLALSLASHVCSSCPRSVHGLQYEDCWRIRWMSSMTWWRLASSTLVR